MEQDGAVRLRDKCAEFAELFGKTGNPRRITRRVEEEQGGGYIVSPASLRVIEAIPWTCSSFGEIHGINLFDSHIRHPGTGEKV